jgi:hypothetical protein
MSALGPEPPASFASRAGSSDEAKNLNCRRPLALGCPQALEVVAGERTQLRFVVRNDSGTWVRPVIEVAGVAADWVPLPPRMGPLAPGETRPGLAELLVPAGYPECAMLVRVRVMALQVDGQCCLGPPCSQELVLRVGGGDALALLLPSQVVGGLAARFQATVSSRSDTAQLAEVAGHSPTGARVTIKNAQLRLGPRETAAVTGRVRHSRALAGEARRLPFVISVKSAQSTCSAVAVFVQRPWLGTWAARVLATVATVLAFAALAVFVITRVSDSYTPRANLPTGYKQVPSGAHINQSAWGSAHLYLGATPAGSGRSRTVCTARGGESQALPPQLHGSCGSVESARSEGGRNETKQGSAPK